MDIDITQNIQNVLSNTNNLIETASLGEKANSHPLVQFASYSGFQTSTSLSNFMTDFNALNVCKWGSTTLSIGSCLWSTSGSGISQLTSISYSSPMQIVYAPVYVITYIGQILFLSILYFNILIDLYPNTYVKQYLTIYLPYAYYYYAIAIVLQLTAFLGLGILTGTYCVFDTFD